jgi:hypothetical protein
VVSVVALLCAAGIAPADCTQDNAIDVVALSHADNEIMCMQESMTALASLAVQAGPNEYWKIICARSGIHPPVLIGQDEGDQVPAAVP